MTLYSLRQIESSWKNHEWLLYRQAFLLMLGINISYVHIVFCFALSGSLQRTPTFDWEGRLLHLVFQYFSTGAGMTIRFLCATCFAFALLCYFPPKKCLQCLFLTAGLFGVLGTFTKSAVFFAITEFIVQHAILAVPIAFQKGDDDWALWTKGYCWALFSYMPVSMLMVIIVLGSVQERGWRPAHMLSSVLAICYSIICMPFMIESPRALMLLNRHKQAVSALNIFADKTGNALPDDFSGLLPEDPYPPTLHEPLV